MQSQDNEKQKETTQRSQAQMTAASMSTPTSGSAAAHTLSIPTPKSSAPTSTSSGTTSSSSSSTSASTRSWLDDLGLEEQVEILPGAWAEALDAFNQDALNREAIRQGFPLCTVHGGRSPAGYFVEEVGHCTFGDDEAGCAPVREVRHMCDLLQHIRTLTHTDDLDEERAIEWVDTIVRQFRFFRNAYNSLRPAEGREQTHRVPEQPKNRNEGTARPPSAKRERHRTPKRDQVRFDDRRDAQPPRYDEQHVRGQSQPRRGRGRRNDHSDRQHDRPDYHASQYPPHGGHAPPTAAPNPHVIPRLDSSSYVIPPQQYIPPSSIEEQRQPLGYANVTGLRRSDMYQDHRQGNSPSPNGHLPVTSSASSASVPIPDGLGFMTRPAYPN